MKKSMRKLILLSGISFFGAMMLNSCSKNNDSATANNTPLLMARAYFQSNILDRDLVVPYAKDDGATITMKFAGLTFHFTGNGTLTGSATAANDLLSVNGTWSMTANYDKITFNFPTNFFPDLAFMNKQWNIGSNGATIVLTATNGENDELDFTGK